MEHKLGATTLQLFDYTLDDAGNRRSRQESGGSAAGVPVLDAYGYDRTDQVTQVKYAFDAQSGRAARQVEYQYDPVGNRNTVTEDPDGSGAAGAVTTPYGVDGLNQYPLIDGLAAPVYDTKGNLTRIQHPAASVASPAGAIWNYAYDAQNRLIGGTSSTGGSFTFAYDARNCRHRRPANRPPAPGGTLRVTQ